MKNVCFRLLNIGVSEEKPAETIDERIAEILKKFPFISYGRMGEDCYLGIIQNADNMFISIYVVDLIPTEELRKLFIGFGETWWWDSNRKVPINVFIKDERFKLFRTCLRMFSAKDFEILSGPKVSLAESMNRRIRKRQVTLVRKMD